jgi:hypothetical protein
MKSAFCLCLLTLLLLMITMPLRADIARPKPSPQREENKVVLHTGLQIVPDAKAYEARLQISEDTLKRLRLALNEAPTSPSLAARIAHSSTRTIVAGLLLFFSVSFGGVWLARSARSRHSILGRHQKAVAVVLLGIATLGAAAIITRGNAGPPSYYAWRNLPDALSHGRATQGGLDIEIIPEGSGVKLIIPLKNKENGDE